MSKPKVANVAIVDYGMGNIFSIKQMCARVGMQAEIVSLAKEILSADAVILPGVGAFGDAMDALKRSDLVSVLKDVAKSKKPLIGICLGMQLLMTESYEFGLHKGLDIIQGSVVKLKNTEKGIGRFKVPQVGWNRIWQVKKNLNRSYKKQPLDFWSNSLLNGLPDGEFMYFVHSFYAKPRDSSIVLSLTRYGDVEFCSSFQYENIFACQFHPERSCSQGEIIYRNLESSIKNIRKGDTECLKVRKQNMACLKR